MGLPLVDSADAVIALDVAILLVFAAVAISDIRRRRAPRHVWAGIGAVGAVRIVSTMTVGAIVGLVLVATIVTVVSVFGFAIGLFGGADAKAAIAIPFAFPRVPGREAATTVFGGFFQGFEVVVVVCTVAGVAGLGLQLAARYAGVDEDRGVPFLVAIFAAVAVLFTLP